MATPIDHRAWLDNLPANLEGSRLAAKLQAITEIDLDELQATIDPPRGLRPRLTSEVAQRHYPTAMAKLLNLADTTLDELAIRL